MSPSFLRMSTLELTPTNVDRLVSLAVSGADLFRHDIGNALQNALSRVKLAQETLVTFEKTKDARDAQRIADLSANLTDVESQLRRLNRIVQATFIKRGRDDGLEVFISKPREVIDQIAALYPDADITVHSASSPGCELLYPENILFGLLHELILNALRHTPSSRQILVNWSVDDGRFSCSVHDAGHGIIPDLGHGYLPLDALTLESAASKESVGLSIANRVTARSGGLLLFRRSAFLGGTEAHIELPCRP